MGKGGPGFRGVRCHLAATRSTAHEAPWYARDFRGWNLDADPELAGLGPPYEGHGGRSSGASRDSEVVSFGEASGRGGHTQAQNCSSPSVWRPARPRSLDPGWRRDPGVQVGGGSSGRRRRARRVRAAEASTSSGGSERNPRTMSAAAPLSESSARHAGRGAG